MTDQINKKYTDHSDEIDLKELFLVIWNKKILIGAITSLATIISIIYALSLQNIYTSQSLLIPTAQEQSLSSKLGNLSALGSIAGFNLPSSQSTKSQEGIERIKSFEFFSNNFLPNIKLENLMAVDKWIPEENILIYDNKKFNKSNNKWVRDAKYPKKIVPSAQEAFKTYKKILSVNEDKQTSFVSISIEHQSSIVAKKWLDIVIHQINVSMRKIDAEVAEKSIAFLNEASKSTNVQSIKEAIAKLVESQMQTLMLASSTEAYVYKIIDSPIVVEEKSKPNRVMICILGTLLGAMLSLLVIFVQYFIEPSRS